MPIRTPFLRERCCLPIVAMIVSSFAPTSHGRDLPPTIPKRATTLGGEPALYRYSRHINRFRFIIERTNAWVKSFKRLQFRRDYTIYSFEYFLYLALIVICMRRLKS
jgi:hypothetical protein